MKIVNRSDSTVVYSLEELKVRRLFAPNEEKDVPKGEITSLWQTDGGKELIKHELLVDNAAWIEENYPAAPIEYFWREDKVKECLINDSLELFRETLDFAPAGVLEIIKRISWQLPLTDLNKIEAIREKLGFDVLMSIGLMREKAPQKEKPTQRLRKREEEI